jgi:hypothetical protein
MEEDKPRKALNGQADTGTVAGKNKTSSVAEWLSLTRLCASVVFIQSPKFKQFF